MDIKNGEGGWLQSLKVCLPFAIWVCPGEKLLFLARDKLGMKPLYYVLNKDGLLFASEIKALLKVPGIGVGLDMASLSDYLVYRYVPDPYTIWREIRKLSPASCMSVPLGGTPTVETYWEMPIGQSTPCLGAAVEEFDSILSRSVLEHLDCDVSVGAFLSGGYDSSAILYYMTKNGASPQVFSVGFEGWEASEHKYAKIVSDCFGCDINDIIVNARGPGVTRYFVICIR